MYIVWVINVISLPTNIYSFSRFKLYIICGKVAIASLDTVFCSVLDTTLWSSLDTALAWRHSRISGSIVVSMSEALWPSRLHWKLDYVLSWVPHSVLHWIPLSHGDKARLVAAV